MSDPVPQPTAKSPVPAGLPAGPAKLPSVTPERAPDALLPPAVSPGQEGKGTDQPTNFVIPSVVSSRFIELSKKALNAGLRVNYQDRDGTPEEQMRFVAKVSSVIEVYQTALLKGREDVHGANLPEAVKKEQLKKIDGALEAAKKWGDLAQASCGLDGKKADFDSAASFTDSQLLALQRGISGIEDFAADQRKSAYRTLKEASITARPDPNDIQRFSNPGNVYAKQDWLGFRFGKVAFDGEIRVPDGEFVRGERLAVVQKLVDDNKKALISLLNTHGDKLPSFGLSGMPEERLEKIEKHREPVSIDGKACELWTAVVAKRTDRTETLYQDLLKTAGTAYDYSRSDNFNNYRHADVIPGGLLVTDVSAHRTSKTNPALPGAAIYEPETRYGRADGSTAHAGRLAVKFTPAEYDLVVRGVIPRELFARFDVPADKLDSEMPQRLKAAQELREQAIIAYALHHTGFREMTKDQPAAAPPASAPSPTSGMPNGIRP